MPTLVGALMKQGEQLCGRPFPQQNPMPPVRLGQHAHPVSPSALHEGCVCLQQLHCPNYITRTCAYPTHSLVTLGKT